MRTIIIVLVAFFLNHLTFAGKPLWTFTSNSEYPTNLTMTKLDTAYIEYTITNQSKKPHTLEMRAIAGISQLTTSDNCKASFTLNYKESCTLSLKVSGSELQDSIYGGPIICENGLPLQCYQPDSNQALNIKLVAVQYYIVTPSAGVEGNISPSTPQQVLSGTNIEFNAMPNAGYQVDEWLVDDALAQKGGNTFELTNITQNHSVKLSFTRSGSIFTGMQDGSIYYSIDNGLNWTNIQSPSNNQPVNGLYVTDRTIYVASADGKVYYSTNNGNSWATTTSPDSSAINTIYVMNDVTMYVGTQNGNIFTSNNRGTSWTQTTASPGGAINGIYVTANRIYAASANGYIYYSTNNGANWNAISGPTGNAPIRNIFEANGYLYINTQSTSTNTTLPPNTINFEYAYKTNDLNNPNPTWIPFSQITYTLFVNNDASSIYAATQNGHVFSLVTGEELGFINYSPITSLFFFG